MTIKQHDTNITFLYTPTINGVALTAEQLEGCTVSWLLKGETAAFKRTAEITPELQFKYRPVDEDVATAGAFKLEWELKDALNKILTFPNDGYYGILIAPDLG